MQQRKPVVWFDLESTGLPPFDMVDIVEIAIVHADAETQKLHPPYSDVVKPPRGIPKSVFAFMPLRDKDVADKPSFKEIAPMVHKMMHDHVWAGHNIRRFDIPLLELEFRRAGLEPPRCAGVIDTYEFATKHFAGRRGLFKMKLEVLAQYFGIISPDENQTHRALDDVLLNIRVAQRMFAQVFMESALLPQAPQQAESKPEELKTVPAVPVVPVLRCQAFTQAGTHCKNRICKDGKDASLCSPHLKMAQKGYTLRMVEKQTQQEQEEKK